MTVITISREIGSGGDLIGQNLAKLLSYQFIDKNLIEKILAQYGLIQFEEMYNTAPNIWSLLNPDYKALVEMLNKTIKAYASLDNVIILGRGGFAILQDYSNVLNIRVQAPLPYRAKNLQTIDPNLDKNTAEEIIKQDDHLKQSFINTFYDTDWKIATNFDLLINTSKVSLKRATSWIIDVVKELEAKPDHDSYSKTNVKVDAILLKTINETKI